MIEDLSQNQLKVDKEENLVTPPPNGADGQHTQHGECNDCKKAELYIWESQFRGHPKTTGMSAQHEK